MKSRFQTIVLACVALLSASLASCTDDALVEASRNYGDQPFKLTVSQSGSDSRLALDQDGLTTMWEPGDKLVLVDKNRTLAPIYLNCELEEKASKATFVSESGVPAGDYYVIYNYNENLAYGHKGFQSVDEINSHDDLVLWAELHIAEGVSSATVSLQHLYAKVRVVLQNADNLGVGEGVGFQIGMYSSKKGFPVFKQFTSTGLVDAEYGINPNSMSYTGNYTYFPSNRKFHNIRFGNYAPVSSWIEPEPGVDDATGYYTYDWTSAEGRSALVLPADLTGEDMFFYVLSNNTCYEFKKAGVNIKAGTSYKVVLDMNQANAISTLSSTYDNDTYQTAYQLTNAAAWRHAAYRNGNAGWGWNNDAYEITQSIDFTNEYFFPIATTNLKGGGYTLSNINLDWSDEDNVGLIRHEWDSRNEKRVLQNVQLYEKRSEVSNLTLENVTFKGKNYVGALGGWNIKASNCNVIGTSVVEGNNYVGGLVGVNRFVDSEMYFVLNLADVRIGQSCTVSGNNYVGGILGGYVETYYYSYDTNSSLMLMESAKSEATVTGTDYVGGIFGKLGGNIYTQSTSTSINFTMEDYTFSLIKCVNEGKVTGRHYVGGIGGDFAMTCNNYSTLDRVVLSQSCSTGNVTGETKVGGILGSSMATPNICYSTGTISATSIVGGIVGDFSMGYQARIANCYSLATISAKDNVKTGGIVGAAGGGMMGTTITKCYYAADPDTYSFGGIVGYSAGSTSVTNCLTTLNSLGNNLGNHQEPTGCPDEDGDGIPDQDWNGDGNYDINDLYYFYNDVTTGSIAAVTSILDNITVINGDNAYSTNIWDINLYPWYCVKFASFSADTDSPDYDDETIQ